MKAPCSCLTETHCKPTQQGCKSHELEVLQDPEDSSVGGHVYCVVEQCGMSHVSTAAALDPPTSFQPPIARSATHTPENSHNTQDANRTDAPVPCGC